MEIRKATLKDVVTTYKWAKDKAIRKYSFSQDEISFDEHSKWFESKLDNTNCIYLIAEFDGKSIGSIRYDIENTTAKINYLIDTAYQGRGFGKEMLELSIEYLQKNTNIKKIYGEVFLSNTASVKIFEKLDFIKTDLKVDLLSYHKIISE